MNRIATFEKISWTQFQADFTGVEPETVYSGIRLPHRATAGSAGYDFFALQDLALAPGESLRIPTGVRVQMLPGWVLLLFPRSGLGFRYRLQLDNTVGVIDSDYYQAKNEGHILAKLTNAGRQPLRVAAGEALFQGVFVPFGLTTDDAADGLRAGGFGSTD